MKRNKQVIVGIIFVITIFFLSGWRGLDTQPERYEELMEEARQAAEEGIAGSVRSGIYTYYAENRAFPVSLDSAAIGDCTLANPCFSNVLEYEVTDEWLKLAPNTYIGPAGGEYQYSSSDGSFERKEKVPSEEGVVGSVRSGIYTYYAENRAFPVSLDSAAIGGCTISNPCFGNVLEYEVIKGWSKVAPDTYIGPSGGKYKYLSGDGSFE